MQNNFLKNHPDHKNEWNVCDSDVRQMSLTTMFGTNISSEEVVIIESPRVHSLFNKLPNQSQTYREIVMCNNLRLMLSSFIITNCRTKLQAKLTGKLLCAVYIHFDFNQNLSIINI